MDNKQPAESGQDSFLVRVRQTATTLDYKTRDTSARKTYVIDKFVLQIFNSVAKACGLPRDLLVDLALNITKAERQAKTDSLRKRYKDAKQQIDQLWAQTESLKKDLQRGLGGDDPIISRLGLLGAIFMNLSLSIRANLERNTPIDPDDLSQSC